MFKLAFPWAQHSEEQAERDYIKSLPASSQDEVAGNVWISERFGAYPNHRFLRASERATGTLTQMHST